MGDLLVAFMMGAFMLLLSFTVVYISCPTCEMKSCGYVDCR